MGLVLLKQDLKYAVLKSAAVTTAEWTCIRIVLQRFEALPKYLARNLA